MISGISIAAGIRYRADIERVVLGRREFFRVRSNGNVIKRVIVSVVGFPDEIFRKEVLQGIFVSGR